MTSRDSRACRVPFPGDQPFNHVPGTLVRPSMSGGRAWTTCRARSQAALIWMRGKRAEQPMCGELRRARHWRSGALLSGCLPGSGQRPAQAHLHGRVTRGPRRPDQGQPWKCGALTCRPSSSRTRPPPARRYKRRQPRSPDDGRRSARPPHPRQPFASAPSRYFPATTERFGNWGSGLGTLGRPDVVVRRHDLWPRSVLAVMGQLRPGAGGLPGPGPATPVPELR